MESKTKLTASPHLQVIMNGAKALVYDSITGNKIIVNSDALKVIEMIRKGRKAEDILREYDAPCMENLTDILVSKKLFFAGQEADVSALKGIDEEKIRSGGLLRHLRLNITESCNLDCTYCYEKESAVFTKRRKMDWEVAKRSIDSFIKVIKQNNQKSVSIRFFGGEPLLNWPLIKRSIAYIKECGLGGASVTFTVNTNGTLLSEEIIKLFRDHNVYISLSLDGVEEENDQFRKFRDGRGIFNILDKKIMLLARHKARFGVAVVFYDQNLPHLHKLIDYIKKKQEETSYRISVNFSPLARINRQDMDNLAAADKAAYLVKAIKYAGQQGVQCFGGISHFPFTKLLYGVRGAFCGGVGAEFSIDPEGNVYPCSGLDIKLGHLDTFMDIFDTPAYTNIAARRQGNLPHCKDCAIEGFCAGGCLADVQYSDGDIYGVCRDCDFQRELFKELVKNYLLG